MDPDETLTSMRRSAENIIRLDDERAEVPALTNDEIAIHAVDLAEQFQALDNWLRLQGFHTLGHDLEQRAAVEAHHNGS